METGTSIRVLCGGAMKSLMAEAVPLCERKSGVRIAIEFRLTSILQKEIENGAAFDVALLPRAELDALTHAGKIAADTTADVARSPIGLCVRAGARKPEIETVAALKRSLLEATSISYSDGPSGAYIAGLLKRLGIAVDMKPKTKLTSRPVAELVASGDAEVGMQQIVAILPVEGAELVGPLPGELQNVVVYAAGVASRSRNPAPARAVIDFMRTGEARRLIRAKGLQPG